MASGQDIHICGNCRAGFSHIWEFIKHKKACCLGSNAIPSTEQLATQDSVQPTSDVQLPVLNSSFNCSLTASQSLPNCPSNLQTVIGNQEDSSSYRDKVQLELGEKLQPMYPNIISNSLFEDTVSLSSPLVTEGIKYYSYPKPSPSSISQDHLENTSAHLLPSRSPKEETIFQHNSRHQGKKVLTDDIAVYIVSPKSFASSVTKPKVFQNLTGDMLTKLHGSCTFGNDDLESINLKDKSTELKPTECYPGGADTYQVPTVHVLLPDNTSCLYTDSSLPSVSDSSTPCPEDLEVGQISASVLCQSPQAPQTSGRSFVSDISNSCVKLQVTNNPLNSESLTVTETSCAAATSGHPQSAVNYRRQNTASAPTVVRHTRETRDQRISIEKRERLKGLSDDLLASFHQAQAPIQTNDSFPQSEEKVSESPINSSFINLSKVKSFKAVFTSPSRSGHRLRPTEDLNPIPPDSSVSQQALECSGHTQLTHGSSAKGRARVYKNISAAVKPLQHLDNTSEGNSMLLLNNDTPQKRMKKGAERQIIFDNKCAKSLCSVLQPPTGSLGSDNNAPPGQVNSQLVCPTKKEAVNVYLRSAEAVSAPLSLPVTSSVLANRPVRGPDAGTNTQTSITSVTAAVKQQIPTALCSSVATQPSQLYHTNPTSVLAGQDTVLVYKNQDTNFFIVPGNVHSLPAVQLPEQSCVVQQQPTLNSGVTPLSITNQAVKQIALQMHEVVQGQQPQHGQTQTAYFLKEDGTTCSVSTVSAYTGYSQHSSSTECRIQAPNQPDPINSLFYLQAPKVSSSTSNTLPTMVCAVTGNVATPEEISDTSLLHNHMSASLAREPCIIRPKTNPRKQKTMTQTSAPHSHTQPQYEINCSNQHGDSNKKERIFTCKFDKCRYSSSLYKDFRRHYRTHTGETPYSCLQCGKSFSRSDKLRIHQRAHDGTKPFQCNLCDYKTLESGNLKKHLRIHSDERPYKCQICPYASRNSSHLIVHLRSHTGDAPFVCSECGAQFRIGTDLKRHMRTHTGEKPFQCDLCDYRCAHKGNLKSHMRINHSKDGEVSCEHCDFSSSSRKRLKEHAKLHDPSRSFKCQQCPLTFPTARALRAHLCTHDTVKPYQCSYCPYACKRSGNLKKHVVSQHMDRLQKTPSKIKGKRKTTNESGVSRGTKSKRKVRGGGERPMEYLKQHKCHQCGHGFVRLDSLLSHMNQHKREEGHGQSDQSHGKQINSPGVTAIGSSSRLSSDVSTLPPTVRRQGMRHIAAAASKLFEENYGSTKQTLPFESCVRDEPEPKQQSSVGVVEASMGQQSGGIPTSATWEHSYTISLPPAPDSHAGLALNPKESQSHTVTPFDAHNKPEESADVLEKVCWKTTVTPPSVTQEMAVHKTETHPTHVVNQPAQSNPVTLSDHSAQQKPEEQQLQFVMRSHSDPIQLQSTPGNATKIKLDVAGQPFIYQQREELASQETSYSFQIVPQVLTPAQLVRQIVLPPAQSIQAAPRHIQIVLPGTSVTDQQASSQIIQQQVVVQEYPGRNEMEVLSMPYNQFPRGPSTKVFQTVTSTKPGQAHQLQHIHLEDKTNTGAIDKTIAQS